MPTDIRARPIFVLALPILIDICGELIPTNPNGPLGDVDQHEIDQLEFDVSFVQEDEMSFDCENRPVFRQRRMFNRRGPF